MKQTNCNKCIHINICQFINNNNLSEKDWEFIHDNFTIKCNEFKNKNEKDSALESEFQVQNAKEKMNILANGKTRRIIF